MELDDHQVNTRGTGLADKPSPAIRAEHRSESCYTTDPIPEKPNRLLKRIIQ